MSKEHEIKYYQFKDVICKAFCKECNKDNCIMHDFTQKLYRQPMKHLFNIPREIEWKN